MANFPSWVLHCFTFFTFSSYTVFSRCSFDFKCLWKLGFSIFLSQVQGKFIVIFINFLEALLGLNFLKDFVF